MVLVSWIQYYCKIYFVNICMYLLLCRNKLFFLFLYRQIITYIAITIVLDMCNHFAHDNYFYYI